MRSRHVEWPRQIAHSPGSMLDSVLRRLARDQWVRLHGTPRVTVLVGGAHGREIWNQWIGLSGMAGKLFEGEPIDDQIRAAVTHAVAEPAHPVAVVMAAEAAARWRTGRRDRLAAMVDEGWIAVPEPAPPLAQVRPELDARSGAADRAGLAGREGDDGRAADPADRGGADGSLARGAADAGWVLDARSVAEATLFEALEATPATAGRFRLNESLSVRFGPTAAEIDLLSRGDRIAIEIDGFHHFADLDCYRRDRRKDLLLQTQGFVVVRLLAEDVVRDVRSAVTAVNQALAYRSQERR
jgi:very-short-patch-repair endonuclease